MTEDEFLEGVTKPIIKLNGGFRIFEKKEISYEDIISLLGVKSSEQTLTITYMSKEKDLKGFLEPNKSITMIDRLIINADRTDNA